MPAHFTTITCAASQALRPEARTYNTVLGICNAAGQHAATLSVFYAMQQTGVAPNSGSFNAAIAALCKCGG